MRFKRVIYCKQIAVTLKSMILLEMMAANLFENLN